MIHTLLNDELQNIANISLAMQQKTEINKLDNHCKTKSFVKTSQR